MNATEQGGDPAALQEILAQLEQSVASYSSIVSDVRGRLNRIATERAGLGALRTRLTTMNELARGWDRQVWDMDLSEELARSARANAGRQVRAHIKALDDLIWDLFDFREKT
jgi:hypothetical protein